jgi:hypothetical protein
MARGMLGADGLARVALGADEPLAPAPDAAPGGRGSIAP